MDTATPAEATAIPDGVEQAEADGVVDMPAQSRDANDTTAARRRRARASKPRGAGMWPFVAVVAGPLAVLSAFSSPTRAEWLTVGAGSGAVLAAAVPVLQQRRPPARGTRRRAHPLALIAAGLWLTVLGEGLHAAGAPFPSYADAIELGAYPLIILGLLRLVRARLRERPLDTLLVAAIAPTALGAFAWMPLVTAVTRWVPDAHRAAWMTVAFLAVDMLAVAMLARLTLMFRGRPLSHQLLLAAFGAMLGAHVSRAAATVTSVVPAPFGSQTLMIVGFGLLAAAALHPTLLPASIRLRPRPAPIGRAHVALLAMAVVVAPFAVAIEYGHAGDWVLFAVAAPAIVSLLVIAHLARMVHERGRLEHESTHDLLTSLPNRARFNDALVSALLPEDSTFAVGFLDLDRFKKVNDSLGHDAGDELLRQVAKRLRERVRTGDVVARLSGDEFAVLINGIDGEQTAVTAARRVLDAFGAPFVIDGQELFVTPSIGLALAPDHGEDAETLLKHADLAMYEAKRCGRNTVEVYAPRLGADGHQQLTVETRLHAGIDAGELVVHYQPKVMLRTGEVTGVEALVRWQHPTIGLVSPGAFVQLAEETGLIATIGERVLQDACRQVAAWRRSGFPNLTVSVNLSIRQFQLHDVRSVVARTLSESGLPPHALELELTESAELGQGQLVGDVLESLRGLGVRCSIDDFGSGYTGIAYLNRLPVDKIKLDKSFIDSIGNGATDAPFVRAMIAMAHSLGLEVIAEGVEKPEQAEFLLAHGCDTIQGFLFSRPLPADDLYALLDSLRREPDAPPVPEWPSAAPANVRYAAAATPRDLGDLLWAEEQVDPSLGGAADVPVEEESGPETLAHRTLVLSGVAGIMALPLFLGLGSAGALPPKVQHAVSTALADVGATPPLRPHTGGPGTPLGHSAPVAVGHAVAGSDGGGVSGIGGDAVPQERAGRPSESPAAGPGPRGRIHRDAHQPPAAPTTTPPASTPMSTQPSGSSTVTRAPVPSPSASTTSTAGSGGTAGGNAGSSGGTAAGTGGTGGTATKPGKRRGGAATVRRGTGTAAGNGQGSGSASPAGHGPSKSPAPRRP